MENVKEVLKLSVEQKGALVSVGELTVYLDGLTVGHQEERAPLTNGNATNGNSEFTSSLLGGVNGNSPDVSASVWESASGCSEGGELRLLLGNAGFNLEARSYSHLGPDSTKGINEMHRSTDTPMHACMHACMRSRAAAAPLGWGVQTTASVPP